MNFRIASFLCILLACIASAQAQMSVDDARAKLKAREKARQAATQAAASQPSGGSEAPATQAIDASKSQTRFLEDRYDDGKLKARYTVSPTGVKWGPFTLFSEDGKIVESGAYKDGELDGERKVFFATGQIQLRQTYKAGQLDGPLREYDEKGSLIRSVDYLGGNPAHIQKFQDGIPVVDQTYVDGLLVYPRSTTIIIRELKRIDAMKVATIPASAPIPPHAGTNDSQKDREDAVRTLMQYRYLCNVPYENMVLDPVYNAQDEAAAAILAAVGALTHKPQNPGWPIDRYQYAFVGTSHSNINMLRMRINGGASSGVPDLCKESVGQYMDDSDAGNLSHLGHRRWCINPPMGKVGFAGSGGFSAMWSMDTSRNDVPDFDYIAYPAPGFFPDNFFDYATAWSVSLNEGKYQTPDAKSVKVVVTPVQVQAAQNKIAPVGAPLNLEYFHIDLEGFGISNCIIFQPGGVQTKPGCAYLVEITGLKDNRGKPAAIKYVVEFFRP